jgi:hypothetical protein
VIRKRLRTIGRPQTSLGLSTIMDRALADEHGVKYVHLTVFAIDIDRVYWLEPERADLPFGWEVFLSEYRMLADFDPNSASDRELIAAICAHVLEQPPGEPPLGGQIVFAVHDAVAHQRLDPQLSALFASWNKAPEDLEQSLSQLWEAPRDNARKLAEHCLRASLTPPLAPPTREALERMVAAATS